MNFKGYLDIYWLLFDCTTKNAYVVYVSLSQSILRQANFKGANLVGASFFDADLTGKFIILYIPFPGLVSNPSRQICSW